MCTQTSDSAIEWLRPQHLNSWLSQVEWSLYYSEALRPLVHSGFSHMLGLLRACSSFVSFSPHQAWLCTVGFCAHFVIGVVAALGAVSTQPSAFGLRQREGHRGNNMSLNDNVRDSAAQLFVAPAIILSGVDELCAQTQPATHLPTEPPSSEAVFLPTCASSHDRPPHLPRVMCDLVSHSVEPLALTYACSQPKPQDIHRELGLGAEYDNQRHARPLVGGVSCPPQFVSMFLAMQMTLPLAPSAAAAKTVVDAAESMEGAAATNQSSRASQTNRLGCPPLTPQQIALREREVQAYLQSPMFKQNVADAMGHKVPSARFPSIIEFLESQHVLQPGQSVLDLGCGAGAALRHLSKAYDRMGGANMTGVELLQAWVEAARRAVPHARFVSADITDVELGEPPPVYDLVMLNDVIEHVIPERLECLFSTIARHTDEGSALYFHVPAPETQIAEGELGGKQFFENVVPYHVLVQGLAQHRFQLEHFELDKNTDCRRPGALLGRSTAGIGASCTYANQAAPKYAHLLFRRSSDPQVFVLSLQHALNGSRRERKLAPRVGNRVDPQHVQKVHTGLPAMDRFMPEVKVDLMYKLQVQDEAWNTTRLSSHLNYRVVMQALHGRNLWADNALSKRLPSPSLSGGLFTIPGSPLNASLLQRLFVSLRPQLVLEVGVFHGRTSIQVAKLMDQLSPLFPQLKRSFVISMDSWLHDLRFVWRADKQLKERFRSYLDVPEVAGSAELYYTFLANCIAANVTHRIVPLRTSSANGALPTSPAFQRLTLTPLLSPALLWQTPLLRKSILFCVGAMALLAHKLRPQLIYVDASHANPDVYVDYENFYTILAPGGAMAVDDVGLVPAVRKAFDALVEAYGLTPQFYDSIGGKSNQAVVWKPLKKPYTSTSIRPHRDAQTMAQAVQSRWSSALPVKTRGQNQRRLSSISHMQQVPVLMVVGVQKGGTTFLGSLFNKLFCGSVVGEPHFWSDMCLAKASVGPSIKDRYLESHFNASSSRCGPGELQLVFEKSPALYTKPWAPIRLVEAFRASSIMPRIVMLLRNPTLRAWSGFLQCYPYLRDNLTGNETSTLGNTTLAHQLFASLARLEMDVVDNCPVPVGSGNFTADYANARDFGACCEAVAFKHGHHMWPGCRAYGKNSTASTLYRCTKVSSQLGLRPSDENRWSGGAFGDYCFDFVRQGIYVNYLPAWFSSGLDVNLVLSEELFSNPYGVAKRILKLTHIPFRAIDQRLNITLKRETRRNAKAVGSLARMPEKTKRALNRFYHKYNQKLTSIYLHRDPEWY